MKYIIFSISCLILFINSSPGLDYYKNLLEDPLKWVDTPMPREVLSLENEVLHVIDKNRPEFEINLKEWKRRNFGIEDNDGLLG